MVFQKAWWRLYPLVPLIKIDDTDMFEIIGIERNLNLLKKLLIYSVDEQYFISELEVYYFPFLHSENFTTTLWWTIIWEVIEMMFQFFCWNFDWYGCSRFWPNNEKGDNDDADADMKEHGKTAFRSSRLELLVHTKTTTSYQRFAASLYTHKIPCVSRSSLTNHRGAENRASTRDNSRKGEILRENRRSEFLINDPSLIWLDVAIVKYRHVHSGYVPWR